MYVGISLIYASVAGALVSFVEPLAAGSGIAEVKTYLNGIHIRGLLAVSHTLALPRKMSPFPAGPLKAVSVQLRGHAPHLLCQIYVTHHTDLRRVPYPA